MSGTMKSLAIVVSFLTLSAIVSAAAAQEQEARTEDSASTLSGMMVYFADAARLTECRSGRSYPIVMEGDYLALERAYLEFAGGPAAELLVPTRLSQSPMSVDARGFYQKSEGGALRPLLP